MSTPIDPAAETAADEPLITASAERLRAVPATPFSTSGTLKLYADRLTFTSLIGSKVILDVPFAEMHTVQKMAGPSFRFWHGSTRWRFSTSANITPPVTGSNADSLGGALANAAALPGAFAAQKRANAASQVWTDTLTARATGTPPDGFQISQPWPMWAWSVGIVGFAVVFLGALIGGAFLFA
jgi:hypothetical protein